MYSTTDSMIHDDWGDGGVYQAEHNEEESKLEALKKQIIQHQLRLDKSKEQLEKQAASHKQKERSRHERREKELEREANKKHEERIKIEAEIEDLKLQKVRQDEQQMHIDNDVDQMEKGAELEALILKRMELARHQNKAKELSDKVRNHQIHIQSIEDEKQHRDDSDVTKLSRLLDKADVLEKEILSGEYSKREQARIVAALYDETENQTKGFSVLDAVVEKRDERFANEASDREDLIRKLNEEREKIIEKEADLKKRKVKQEALAAKGTDFLVEIELGHAPPVDFILRNIVVPEEDYNNIPVVSEAIENVVGRLEKGLSKHQDRVAELRAKLTPGRPYDGYLGLRSYNPEQVGIAKEMRALLLTKLLPKMLEAVPFDDEIKAAGADIPTKSELEKRMKVLDDERSHLDFEIRSKATSKLMVTEMQCIIDETIEKMIADMYLEVIKVKKLAISYAQQIILSSVRSTDDPGSTDTDNLVLATLVQTRKTRKKANDHKRFVHRLPTIPHAQLKLHEERLAEDPTSKKAKAKAKAKVKQEKTKAKAKAKSILQDEEEEREEEEGCINLDLKITEPIVRDLNHGEDERTETLELLEELEEVPTVPIGLPGFDDIHELNVWKSLLLDVTPVPYEGHKIKNCTAVEPSPDGRLLAIAIQGGNLLVFALDGPQMKMIKRLTPLRQEASAAIDQITWGMDNTQLATLDKSKVVTVWDLSYAVPEVAVDRGRRVAVLYPGDFARIKGPEGNKKNSRNKDNATHYLPKSFCFHPSFNLGLKHSSLMFGLSGGDILKWNMFDGSAHNKSMIYGAIAKLPSQPDFTEHAHHSTNGLPGKRKGKGAASKYTAPRQDRDAVITREFFVGHSSAILFVGQVGSTTDMVTVDMGGYVKIWPYQRKSFSGFGWFHPSETSRINTKLQFFSRLGKFEETEILFEGWDDLGRELPDSLTHSLWWWDWTGKSIDGLEFSGSDLLSIRTASEEYTKTEEYDEFRKCIQDKPLRETVHGHVHIITYPPWTWDENHVVQDNSDADVVKSSCHTFIYWHIEPKLKKGENPKPISYSFRSKDGWVLVMHTCHPLVASTVRGLITEVLLTPSRTDLVVCVRWPYGGGSTSIQHTSKSVVGHSENTGYDGTLAYFKEDEAAAWFKSGQEHGSAFCQIHMLSLEQKVTHYRGFEVKKEELAEHLPVVKLSPFLVTFPIDVNDPPVSVVATPVLDISRSDMLAIFRKQALYIHSVHTANLIYVVDDEFSSFGRQPVFMRAFIMRKFADWDIYKTKGDSDIMFVIGTHRISSGRRLRIVRLFAQADSKALWKGVDPPRWTNCPENLRCGVSVIYDDDDEF